MDVGCGSGKLLKQLRDSYGATVKGVDFSAEAIRHLSEKGIDGFQGLFLDFEPDGKFDVIFMNNYLEHTLDPLKELCHAYGMLAENGQLVGLLPNFGSADRAVFGKYWGGNHCPRHTFQFKQHTLRSLLQEAGFQSVSVRNKLHGAHISISLSNMFFARALAKGKNTVRREEAFKRMPLFGLITLACTLPSLLFAIFGKNGASGFVASKTNTKA